MSVVPFPTRSSGTSAVHSADSTTASSSPATTSYQYQPPSTNGVSVRSNENTPDASVVLDSDATRCERPLAIDLYTVTAAPRPLRATVSCTSDTTVQRRQ